MTKKTVVSSKFTTITDNLSTNTPFLFYRIADDHLLMAIKPAGKDDYKEVEGMGDMGH